MSRSEAGRLALRGCQRGHIEPDFRGVHGTTERQDVREVAAEALENLRERGASVC